MPKRLRWLAATTALALPVTCAAAPHAAAAGRTASISARVSDAFRGSTASHVAYRFRVAGEGTVAARHATSLSAPASNEKLLTTVTLLQQVTADFHYVTRVSYTGTFTGHVIDGDLVLTGSGDPTLSRSGLATLAKRVHRAGVRRIRGHVVVDDSRYSHRTLTHGWKHSFVPAETGTVDAFTVDRNTWRRGSAFDADPTPANAGLWKNALTHHHVAVRGKPVIEPAPADSTQLLTHSSGSLGQIVHKTLTDSDNFYAEMLLREAGAQFTGHGTLRSGLQAIRAQAAALRLSLGKVDDGSGLSYADRESPSTLVGWLEAAAQLESYPTVLASLPVSCRTGTLKHRLCGSGLAGRVHAKTGTLNHVNALSGWASTASGRRVTFSVLLSGVRNPSAALRHLDAAVAKVVRSR